MFFVDNKLYAICADCGKTVTLNKILFGSLHICIDEKDKKVKFEGLSYPTQEELDERKRLHELTGIGYGLVAPQLERLSKSQIELMKNE